MRISRRLEPLLFPFIDISLNGINYLFHVISGRFLIPTEYGILNALLGILAVLYVTGSAIQVYVAREEAESGEEHGRYTTLFVVSIIVFLCAFIPWSFLLPYLKTYTRANAFSLWLIPIIFFINFTLSIGRGIMQGRKEFMRLNISFSIETLSKTLILFVWLPRTPLIETVLLALLLGTGAAFFHTIIALSPHFRRKRIARFLQNRSREVAALIGTLIPLILSHLFIYFLTSIDMVIFNYRFPAESGVFAVLEKYGMLMLFVPFSLFSLYLPYLSGAKGTPMALRRKMIFFFLLQTAVSITMIAVYHFVLPPTVAWFFGKAYAPAATHLTAAGIVYGLLAADFYFINCLTLFNSRLHLFFLTATGLLLALVILPRTTGIEDILFKETLLYAALLPFLIFLTIREVRKL